VHRDDQSVKVLDEPFGEVGAYLCQLLLENIYRFTLFMQLMD
jgi:hypothetical protein